MATTVNINDLPSEVIEKFGMDLPAKTVSQLRLVNRRFRDIFVADVFYRNYMLYDYYKTREDDRRGKEGLVAGREEIRDRVDVGGPQDASHGADVGGGLPAGGEEKDGELEGYDFPKGRWRRRLEAEKRTLQNWKTGRARRVDTVVVPREVPEHLEIRWQGSVGEKGEEWMLGKIEDKPKVILVEATETRPPLISLVDLSKYIPNPMYFPFASILGDQVLADDGIGSVQVFNIVRDGTSLTLQHFFTMIAVDGGCDHSIRTVPGAHPGIYFGFIKTTDDFMIRYDLKKGVRLEDINLRELLPADAFYRRCDFEISEVAYPFVTVIIKSISNPNCYQNSVYAVINVKEGKLDFWFRGDRYSRLWCTVTGSIVSLFCCTNKFAEIRLLERSSMQENLRYSVTLFHYRSPFTKLYFHHDSQKIVFKDFSTGRQKVIVLSTNGTDITQNKIVPVLWASRGIFQFSAIGGFFVDSGHIWCTFDMAGRKMFEWRHLLRRHGISYSNWKEVKFIEEGAKGEFHNIYKCVLQNQEGNNLYICYF